MKTYQVELEVSGRLALWARSDAGGTPTSYPAPTKSACKGLLESIAFMHSGDAWMEPKSVAICRPCGTVGGEVRYRRYTTNYGGPLRKDQNVKAGTGMQVFATVIAEPVYRITALIRGKDGSGGINSRHHLQDLFNRRLKQGRCFRTPALGWREFTCDYWGPFREEYEVDNNIDLVIPSMLISIWNKDHRGEYAPRFAQNVRIEKGVLRYPDAE